MPIPAACVCSALQKIKRAILAGAQSDLQLPRWHADRPELLLDAVQTAYAAAPDLALLARLILPRMARRVLATSTLKTDEAASGRLLLDQAVKQQHIGIRSETHAYAVAVDCDHADWPDLLEELAGHGLPRPTWIAADPWTGRAHLVWWLHDAVVLTESGRGAPQRLLSVVAQLLTEALKGDHAYTNVLTKNPWYLGRPLTSQGTPALRDLWELHRTNTPELRHAVIASSKLHTLRSLRHGLKTWQDRTEFSIPCRRRKTVSASDSERGSKLFDALRFRVYAVWPVTENNVLALAEEVAAELGSPIKPRQLTGMAQRIHHWCTRFYKGGLSRRTSGNDIARGRDQLQTSGLDLAEKQAIAGRRTADGRRRKTADSLRVAAERLAAASRPITRAALAAEARCSERTVQRIWGRFP